MIPVRDRPLKLKLSLPVRRATSANSHARVSYPISPMIISRLHALIYFWCTAAEYACASSSLLQHESRLPFDDNMNLVCHLSFVIWRLSFDVCHFCDFLTAEWLCVFCEGKLASLGWRTSSCIYSTHSSITKKCLSCPTTRLMPIWWRSTILLLSLARAVLIDLRLPFRSAAVQFPTCWVFLVAARRQTGKKENT